LRRHGVLRRCLGPGNAGEGKDKGREQESEGEHRSDALHFHKTSFHVVAPPGRRKRAVPDAAAVLSSQEERPAVL
jgi:hypothetical protein